MDMKQSLPAWAAPLNMNPPIWDKVVETPTMCAAIAFTKSGQKKMHDMGWLDAVDGKPMKFQNPYYIEGYNLGVKELNS